MGHTAPLGGKRPRLKALKSPSITTRNLTTGIDPLTFTQEADQSAEDQLGFDRVQRRDVRRRMIASLEFFDRHHADAPWAFCLATPLLIADGQIDAGRVFLEQCGRLCGSGLACDYAADLRKRLENSVSHGKS